MIHARVGVVNIFRMDNNHLSASTNAALKSELLKAKHAFDLQRASRPSPHTQKRTALQQKIRPPTRCEEQGSTTWEACHASLLNKAKYYEECLENGHIDDASENALVDFSMKDHVSSVDAFRLSSSRFEWVECVDEFGRSRLVRKDGEPLGPTSNHRSSEVRNKSVGFFQLSADEVCKRQQLETLRRLHHSTLEARTMNSLIKEQKRLKRERRLALASNRRATFICDD